MATRPPHSRMQDKGGHKHTRAHARTHMLTHKHTGAHTCTDAHTHKNTTVLLCDSRRSVAEASSPGPEAGRGPLGSGLQGQLAKRKVSRRSIKDAQPAFYIPDLELRKEYYASPKDPRPRPRPRPVPSRPVPSRIRCLYQESIIL